MPCLREYLSTFAEAMPKWLATYPSPNPRRQDREQIFADFMASRIVFYPGSGCDGGPVAAFNSAHAAHCFIYVDYRVDPEKVAGGPHVHGSPFRGYRSLDRSYFSYRPMDHIHRSGDDYEASYRMGGERPFASPDLHRFRSFIEILERQEEFEAVHGAERFAVMFLAADAFAAFYALFCRNDLTSPFCIVSNNHGFGGNYDRFGAGGLMERLSTEQGVFPKLLLVGVQNTRPWTGYVRSAGVDAENMGMHCDPRSIFERE